MANLSERLREWADCCRDTRPSMLSFQEETELLIEAADLIDRLTVEGLAGALKQREWLTVEEGSWPDRDAFWIGLAETALTYITTPSVEESHD